VGAVSGPQARLIRPATRARSGRGRGGRLLVLAVLAVYFAVVAVPRLLFDEDIWPFLGVPSEDTIFYDARNVAAAADCRRLGHDPLVDNPCDPSARPMNYPRMWLLLRFVGLHQSHTPVFGAVVVLLFVASVLLLVGRLTLPQGALVAAALCSPAVMFAVERGNMDLVLFMLLVLAVVTWQARSEATRLLSPALVLVAAAAKLYGAFALPAYALTGHRRWRWITAGAFALLAAYLVATADDIEKVARAPEGGLLYSFGARILIGHLYHQVVPDEWRGGTIVAQAIAVIPLLVLTAGAWLWARRRLAPGDADPATAGDGALLAFHLGALIYLGTFATRKNGDYRLVCLLLTLPLLLAWASPRTWEPRRRVARAGLTAVLAALWLGALSPYVGPADELASWAVAGLFVALLAATVPPLRPRRAGVPAGAGREAA
jgi:Glycosyltransferase family 87